MGSQRNVLQNGGAPLSGNARLLGLVNRRENRRRGDASRRQKNDQALAPDSRRKQHDYHRRNQRQGRPEVRLHQNQKARNRYRYRGDQKTPEAVMALKHIFTRAEKIRQKRHHAKLRYFTRLEEPEPAPAAELLCSREKNENQKKDGRAVRGNRQITEKRAIIGKRQSKIQHKTERGGPEHGFPFGGEHLGAARLSGRSENHRTYHDKGDHREEGKPVESQKKLSEWQSNVALLTINAHINYIRSKFKRNKKIGNFLESIKKDILKNIDLFLIDPNGEQRTPPVLGPRQEPPKPWENYRVNLFVDNSNQEGAPVIMDSNYAYHNIFGKLEYENYYGALKTDYTMLKPGLLHEANGGYIIFQAKDLISNGICYEALKKALRMKELLIENTADQRSSMVMVSLKPEPIPLDLKVILVGSEQIYQTLLALDEDFRKLFKIKVEFEDTSENTLENMTKIARFIHSFCEQEELPPLDRTAIAKVMEYSSRLADDKEKLSTRFNDISQIVGEAATWAKMDKCKIVTGEYIDKALQERVERIKKYDSRYLEMIKDNTLLINTSGSQVGQINGLTIMSIGDYSFGKPAKITANTYTGKTGIINIEREVELSGSSHSKGVFILSGYLGEMFAQDIPLSLTASICFEQLYNGVDGDSASSTELYAILSSLSGVPINQSLAVTGSVNQKGEIQPIGGVNEKIEGFFQICETRGLDGSHGVIIPIQNVKNLNLSDNVLNAVKNKKFHVYAISSIDEGIELLTGVPAGKKDLHGRFPAGSVNYLAYEKLKKYAEISKKN